MGEKELSGYTYEDYLDIDSSTPEDERVELIFEDIYMMSSASRVHQDVVGSIFFLFKSMQKSKNCSSVIAPYDLKLSCDTKTNVVQPDVMLFCKDEELPCLVCEVLSPSTALKDKSVKKELYECVGIKNYLIVDPLNKYVDKYTLKNTKLVYDKCYGVEDKIYIDCFEEDVEVKGFFE